MLELVEEKRDTSAWFKMREAAAQRKTLNFDLLPTHISTSSASFSMYRAKVPGGWLIAMRPNDSVTFLPDPQHEWDGASLT
jgi:hypothetical protein